jgi:hypothetical protein
MGALLSECGCYRYTLTRRWDRTRPTLVFVMLNPSTADGETDDATIRRCVGFAKREGYGGIIVVNLFAYRATNPAMLWYTADPIGASNDRTITRVALEHKDLVCAWGIHAPLPRVNYVVNYLKELPGVKLRCLGLTKAGTPKHPVRLASDVPLVPYGG